LNAYNARHPKRCQGIDKARDLATTETNS
jgi:hypothetical protein